MTQGPRGMPGIANYRNRPQTVKAILFDGLYHKQMKEFCPILERRLKWTYEIRDNFFIPKNGCAMVVNDGDYIVRDEDGEFYPMTAEVFKKVYEHVKVGS